jgi:zinc protease
MVAETIGAIPKPQRVLTQPYTVEPTQEGEREVILRRVGSVQAIMAAYHIPAALHPDYGAAGGDGARCWALRRRAGCTRRWSIRRRPYPPACAQRPARSRLRASAFVQLKPDQSIDEAQQILLKTVEGFAGDPPTQEEVDRAKARILKNIELT